MIPLNLGYPSGLKNLSTNCYFNAFIQCLFPHIKTIRNKKGSTNYKVFEIINKFMNSNNENRTKEMIEELKETRTFDGCKLEEGPEDVSVLISLLARQTRNQKWFSFELNKTMRKNYFVLSESKVGNISNKKLFLNAYEKSIKDWIRKNEKKDKSSKLELKIPNHLLILNKVADVEDWNKVIPQKFGILTKNIKKIYKRVSVALYDGVNHYISYSLRKVPEIDTDNSIGGIGFFFNDEIVKRSNKQIRTKYRNFQPKLITYIAIKEEKLELKEPTTFLKIRFE